MMEGTAEAIGIAEGIPEIIEVIEVIETMATTITVVETGTKVAVNEVNPTKIMTLFVPFMVDTGFQNVPSSGTRNKGLKVENKKKVTVTPMMEITATLTMEEEMPIKDTGIIFGPETIVTKIMPLRAA